MNIICVMFITRGSPFYIKCSLRVHAMSMVCYYAYKTVLTLTHFYLCMCKYLFLDQKHLLWCLVMYLWVPFLLLISLSPHLCTGIKARADSEKSGGGGHHLGKASKQCWWGEEIIRRHKFHAYQEIGNCDFGQGMKTPILCNSVNSLYVRPQILQCAI